MMTAEFSQVPKQFQGIIQSLRNYDYMSNANRFSESKAQQHVQKLIKWMHDRDVCKPFWIDLLYMLIRQFKIAVLPSFRKSFSKIINLGLINQWNSKATHVIRLLQYIGQQVDAIFDYKVFGLIQLGTLIEKSSIVMIPGVKFEIQNINLSQLQLQTYRFLFRALKWTNNYQKICPSLSGKKFNQKSYQKEKKQFDQLKSEEVNIIVKYENKMTRFEKSFYKLKRQQFRRFAQKFKQTIYERQKVLPHKQNFILIPYDLKEQYKEQKKIKKQHFQEQYHQKEQTDSNQLKVLSQPKTADVATQKNFNSLNYLDDVFEFIDRFNQENNKFLEEGEVKVRYELFLRRICDESEVQVKIEKEETSIKDATVSSKRRQKELKKNAKLVKFEAEEKKVMKKELFPCVEKPKQLVTDSAERDKSELDFQY